MKVLAYADEHGTVIPQREVAFADSEGRVFRYAQEEGEGVWRTIRGRRVFIRKGETATEAVERDKQESVLSKAQAFEREVLSKKKEHINAWDEDGNALFSSPEGHTSGLAHEVKVPAEVKATLSGKNATISHNHPIEAPLSHSDIIFASKFNAREIRAVTPSGLVFRAVRVGKEWPDLSGFKAEYESSMNEFLKKQVGSSLKWQIQVGRAQHWTLEDLSKKYGFAYSSEELK